MNIITKELYQKLPKDSPLVKNFVMDPLDVNNNEKQLININAITVYDATKTEGVQYQKYEVKNHINRTGGNPLIDLYLGKKIEFLDITKIYKYEKNAIITNCCGYNINDSYDYPSHYLCYITILAHKVKVSKIKSFLINIL